jgi:hypothetical protein
VVPFLDIRKLAIAYDTEQNRIWPAHLYQVGSPGVLTVRVGDAGWISLDYKLARLVTALRSKPSVEEISFVPGNCTAKTLESLLSADGPQPLIRYRHAYANTKPIYKGPQDQRNYFRKVAAHTLSNILNDLAADYDGALHKAHSIVVLHGTFPDQELRILKRDDLVWGDWQSIKYKSQVYTWKRPITER